MGGMVGQAGNPWVFGMAWSVELGILGVQLGLMGKFGVRRGLVGRAEHPWGRGGIPSRKRQNGPTLHGRTVTFLRKFGWCMVPISVGRGGACCKEYMCIKFH